MSAHTLNAEIMGDDAFCEAIAGAGEVWVSHAAFSLVPSAFDTGARHSDRHFLHLVTEGALLAEYPDATISVGPGQAIWTGCDLPHRLTLEPTARDHTRCYSLGLRVLRDTQPLRTAEPWRYLQQATALREAFDRVVLGHRESGPLHAHLQRALVTELVVRFLRADAEPGTAASIFDRAQLRALDRYLDAHLADNPTPADLAAVLELSPAYFSDRFRLHFGLPPRTWLTRERLRRAALMLLETPMRIQAIAAAVGYSDQRFFARQFRTHYARTPRAYRRGE